MGPNIRDEERGGWAVEMYMYGSLCAQQGKGGTAEEGGLEWNYSQSFSG